MVHRRNGQKKELRRSCVILFYTFFLNTVHVLNKKSHCIINALKPNFGIAILLRRFKIRIYRTKFIQTFLFKGFGLELVSLWSFLCET